MYTDNEILFPAQAIPALKDLRGEAWRALVERVAQLPEAHEERLAFMLLMMRLNTCINCETDSFRAMKGCTACSRQTLRRFKGEDAELLELYERALHDVREFARKNPQHNVIVPLAP